MFRPSKSSIISNLFPICFRILSAPKARTILVNGAVRKGERLVPPSAFDLLLRVTFPASSTRVKVGIAQGNLLLFFKYLLIFVVFSFFLGGEFDYTFSIKNAQDS